MRLTEEQDGVVSSAYTHVEHVPIYGGSISEDGCVRPAKARSLGVVEVETMEESGYLVETNEPVQVSNVHSTTAATVAASLPPLLLSIPYFLALLLPAVVS